MKTEILKQNINEDGTIIIFSDVGIEEGVSKFQVVNIPVRGKITRCHFDDFDLGLEEYYSIIDN